jgi:hypothetical protein
LRKIVKTFELWAYHSNEKEEKKVTTQATPRDSKRSFHILERCFASIQALPGLVQTLLTKPLQPALFTSSKCIEVHDAEKGKKYVGQHFSIRPTQHWVLRTRELEIAVCGCIV